MARSMLQEWKNELRKLQSQISCRFARPQPRGRALSYLRSLIGTFGHKNCWQIAEAAGESAPDGMQRLLSTARWDAEQVRDDLVFVETSRADFNELFEALGVEW